MYVVLKQNTSTANVLLPQETTRFIYAIVLLGIEVRAYFVASAQLLEHSKEGIQAQQVLLALAETLRRLARDSGALVSVHTDESAPSRLHSRLIAIPEGCEDALLIDLQQPATCTVQKCKPLAFLEHLCQLDLRPHCYAAQLPAKESAVSAIEYTFRVIKTLCRHLPAHVHLVFRAKPSFQAMLANLNSAQQLHQALTSGESGLLTLETGDFLTDIPHDSLKAFLKGLAPELQLSGLLFHLHTTREPKQCRQLCLVHADYCRSL